MLGSARLYERFRRTSVVVAAIMAATVWYFMRPEGALWQGIIVLAIMGIASEQFPISRGKGTAEVTITAPIHWAAIVLFGPAGAIIIGLASVLGANSLAWGAMLLYCRVPESRRTLRKALSSLSGHWIQRRDYPLRYVADLVITNSALDAVVVGTAALVYHFAHGHVLARGYFERTSVSGVMFGFVCPLALCLLAYFLADEIRFVTAWICSEARPEDTRDWYSFVLRWKLLLMETVPLTWRQYLFLPPVTFLLVYLYMHIGFWSGLAVLVPFLSFRLSVQKAVEQEELYLNTIATLGTYMQHYHPYTRGHLKRVSELSERLARELRLPAEAVVLMPYAGLLHDIGKVGVSEEILDKVGKLTDEEWAAIKEHPVKGAEIVEHLEFLDKTVNWIRYHHKWANGSGYPDDGTKNGDVPVEASIIAVADAFDAMTDDREMSLDWQCDCCGYKPEDGDRPVECPMCHAPKRRTYREPLSFDQAVDELRRGAGTQFCPDVVKAFLKMADRDGIGTAGGR